jgi:hypothetical protein
MSNPITFDIPHKLGRVAAGVRLENGLDRFANAIPDGVLVEHHWDGDTLSFVVQGLGRKSDARLTVLDTNVHAFFDFPAPSPIFSATTKLHLVAAARQLLLRDAAAQRRNADDC